MLRNALKANFNYLPPSLEQIWTFPEKVAGKVLDSDGACALRAGRVGKAATKSAPNTHKYIELHEKGDKHYGNLSNF